MLLLLPLEFVDSRRPLQAQCKISKRLRTLRPENSPKRPPRNEMKVSFD